MEFWSLQHNVPLEPNSTNSVLHLTATLRTKLTSVTLMNV